MSSTTEMLVWTFGGPLSGVAPEIAWTVLVVAAVAGVAFVVWSYRHGLVMLARWRRVVLCSLRVGAWLGLLVLLAAPTNVHRTYERPVERPLAVLVDQSQSMTTPDNRQRRRLDDALRRWRAMEPAARTAFDTVKTFAFADGWMPTAALERSADVAAEETKLFVALQEVIASAPSGGWGAVVTLTDGLDTSGVTLSAGIDDAAQGALSAGTPLHFVPGRNRYAGGEFIVLREMTVPAWVSPGTTFRIEAVFDSLEGDVREVPVEFIVDGVARAPESLTIEPGRRLTTWSTEVTAGEESELIVELRAGEERAKSVVRVAPAPTNRILYYQGALDWSYRFLAEAMRAEGAFALTPVMALPTEAVLPPGALRRMPFTQEDLEAFGLVILANVSRDQIPEVEQRVLSGWVRAGGVLLFLTPDDDSAHGFAGSELEKLLPVVFAAQGGATADQFADGAARRLARVRGAMGGYTSTVPLKLSAFRWEETPRVRDIFAEAERRNQPLVAPLFSEYARVSYAKPGADVLARHPTDVADDSDRAVLLAVQRYGRGQSGVLTTDALWRWKLNLPAEERAVGAFWQNLFAWLTRERRQGLRFERPVREGWVEREVIFDLAGAESEPPVVVAQKDGERVVLPAGTMERGVRTYRWVPASEGFWTITATDARGDTVRHWIAVKKEAQRGERSGAAPDEEVLRALALRTGGAVLESDPPPSWQERTDGGSQLLGEQRVPVWHEHWVFWTLLGTYALELLLRRRWKLL